jgi:uncharacterized protein YodC (DUF2158 family)
MAFKEGERVQLKSGGPLMTVEGYEDGYVVCVWFEGTKQKRATFKEGTLHTPPPRHAISVASFIRD